MGAGSEVRLALGLAAALCGMTALLSFCPGCARDRHPCDEPPDPWAIAAVYDSAYVVRMNGYWICHPDKHCDPLRAPRVKDEDDAGDGPVPGDCDEAATATVSATATPACRWEDPACQ